MKSERGSLTVELVLLAPVLMGLVLWLLRQRCSSCSCSPDRGLCEFVVVGYLVVVEALRW